MHYTLMIGATDHATVSLDRCGNHYNVSIWVYGFGCTLSEDYDTYDLAEKRFLGICENSNIEPIDVEHDLAELMANVD